MTRNDMKDSARRIEFIDDLRGLAVLGVFLFHALAAAYGYSMLPWQSLFRDFHFAPSFLALLPLHMGWIGVPIFFVVSGFCIHVSFHQQGRDWRGFFIRRFFRIYPAYLAALLLFMLICAGPNHDGSRQFIYHALLIHNYNAQTYFGVNPAFWTIAIEVQLYLLYPLLLFFVSRFGWKTILIALAIVECGIHSWEAIYETMIGVYNSPGSNFFVALFPYFKFIHTPTLPILGVSPLAFWFSWSLGAYAADAFLNHREMPLAKSSVPFWAFLVVASYLARPLYPFFFTLAAVLATAVVGKYLSNGQPHFPVLDFLQLRRIGIYSYSIYLLHQPLVESVGMNLPHFFPAIQPFTKFLCCLAFWPVMALLAAGWYRLIEVPGVRFGKWLIQRTAAHKTAGLSPAQPAAGKELV